MRGCKQAPIVPAPGVYTRRNRSGVRPGARLPPRAAPGFVPHCPSGWYHLVSRPRAPAGRSRGLPQRFAWPSRWGAAGTRPWMWEGVEDVELGGGSLKGPPGKGDLFPFCSILAPNGLLSAAGFPSPRPGRQGMSQKGSPCRRPAGIAWGPLAGGFCRWFYFFNASPPRGVCK